MNLNVNVLMMQEELGMLRQYHETILADDSSWRRSVDSEDFSFVKRSQQLRDKAEVSRQDTKLSNSAHQNNSREHIDLLVPPSEVRESITLMSIGGSATSLHSNANETEGGNHVRERNLMSTHGAVGVTADSLEAADVAAEDRLSHQVSAAENPDPAATSAAIDPVASPTKNAVNTSTTHSFWGDLFGFSSTAKSEPSSQPPATSVNSSKSTTKIIVSATPPETSPTVDCEQSGPRRNTLLNNEPLKILSKDGGEGSVGVKSGKSDDMARGGIADIFEGVMPPTSAHDQMFLVVEELRVLRVRYRTLQQKVMFAIGLRKSCDFSFSCHTL